MAQKHITVDHTTSTIYVSEVLLYSKGDGVRAVNWPGIHIALQEQLDDIGREYDESLSIVDPDPHTWSAPRYAKDASNGNRVCVAFPWFMLHEPWKLAFSEYPVDANDCVHNIGREYDDPIFGGLIWTPQQVKKKMTSYPELHLRATGNGTYVVQVGTSDIPAGASIRMIPKL